MDDIKNSRDALMRGLGQMAVFWGHNKIIGLIYGLLFLSDKPMALEDIANELQVSKGNVSINIRECERLGMVGKVWVKGDRRDYYRAEPSLWKIIRRVTRERQKKEFDFAQEAVGESLSFLPAEESAQSKFAAKRLAEMSSFLKTINGLISGLIALETLKGAAVQACPVRSRLPKLSRRSLTKPGPS